MSARADPPGRARLADLQTDSSAAHLTAYGAAYDPHTATSWDVQSPAPGLDLEGTLLCGVKGWCGCGFELAVELAGDVSAEAAADLAVGLALGSAALGVGAGGGVES